MNQPGLTANPVLVDLDEETFRALGGRLDGRHGPLSPWNGVDVTVTETQRAKLRELGVADDDRMAPNLRSALVAIASATGKTAVTVVVGGALVQTIVFASNGHRPVALSAASMDNMLRLEDPARSDELVDYVTGVVGRSRLRGLDVSLDMSIQDAFVLAALIDLHRRHMLGELAKGGTPFIPSVSFQAITNVMAQPPRGGFWLLDAIARTCDTEPTRAASGLDDSIAQLARQNLITVEGAAAKPAGVSLSLAEHFLCINTLVELQNVSLDDRGGLQYLGFTCVQAGVSDLMTVEWTQSGIHLESLSADILVGYVDRLVRRPDFGGAPAATPATQQPEPRPLPAQSTTMAVPLPPLVPTQRPGIDKPPWRPTHLAPAGGLSACATPDPSGVPVARIDPGVELQLLERYRDRAHIACSNGWSAWVDARAIQPRPADHAMAARPLAAQPYPAAGRAPQIAAQRPEREPAPTAGSSTPAWRPTHLVPDSGMSAWATPDPNGPPVARIDPRVELRLLERSGAWAHIVCVNGWSGWVDGRAIQPLPNPAGY